jgi:hypothetical protein
MQAEEARLRRWLPTQSDFYDPQLPLVELMDAAQKYVWTAGRTSGVTSNDNEKGSSSDGWTS